MSARDMLDSPTWALLDSPIICSDNIAALAAMPDNSVEAIVTDPPYGIGFMGHQWDQPGEHGPVRSNGTPGRFASGKAYPGESVAGGLSAQTPAQRKRGARAINRTRDGAMEAGRYDLSLTANQRYQAWCEEWAREAYRVLKPGGHLLASGGARTYHRLAAGIEDAGFEIRDSLIWLYGSGFPKSLHVSKAIDKAAGAEREVVSEGKPVKRMIPGADQDRTGSWIKDNGREFVPTETAPATPDAERWEGWGTALKPAHEPIVVARKPIEGTVATNVLEHGTGAVNIDGCRTSLNGDRKSGTAGGALFGEGRIKVDQSTGRWPANVILSHTEDCVLVGERQVRSDGHFPAARGPSGYGSNGASVAASNGGGLKGQDELAERSFAGEMVDVWACVPGCPVRILDGQSGELISGANPTRRGSDKFQTTYGAFVGQPSCEPARGVDRGGASRFFYCAKASRAERNAGLDGFEPVERANGNKWTDQDYRVARGERTEGRESGPRRNVHPTVKPVELMRWLVRMVTPPGGIVLDIFAGSGTTGCAAALEGVQFVGVERDPGYCSIARARVAWWSAHPEGVPISRALAAAADRQRREEAAQASLFDA